MQLQPGESSRRGAARPARARTAPAGWPGPPDRPRQLLRRERLLDRLDVVPRTPLVLVSAPAGTGKTALVADWVATRAPERTEWLTLENEDPFWAGVVGCLARLGVPVLTRGLPPEGGPLGPATRRALALTLASEDDPVTVVVDGYDMTAPAVAGDVDFLLRHSGHRLRLVLLTRNDPVLPLYRYRLEQTVTEVRTADLALTDDEAGSLLRAMGVPLPAASVRRMNEHLTGWVAGVRFAGRTLAGHQDEPGLALGDGWDDDMAAYLRTEVLGAHPPDVQALLMALSIPDTFEPGLAETLAGPSARRALARLGPANAFVEEVPGRPGQHRFAPFFRDLLRAEQAHVSPATTADLQRRVHEWWQAQRSPAVRRLSPSRPRPAPGSVGADLPVEPLTEKEREVLGHLAELLTTEEIAETMFISVNTVRTHVRNILRKLGVSRRNAAVRVARERDLLTG